MDKTRTATWTDRQAESKTTQATTIPLALWGLRGKNKGAIAPNHLVRSIFLKLVINMF